MTQSNFKEAPKALIKGNKWCNKMVIDKATHHILGIFAAGPNATDVVGQMSAMRAAHGQLEDLAAMIQPHPALSETIAKLPMRILIRLYINKLFTIAVGLPQI